MAPLVRATGRITVLALLLSPNVDSAASQLADAGGLQGSGPSGFLASPWFHLLAALGFVLVGVCVQSIRTRPLRRRNAELQQLLATRSDAFDRVSAELESAKRLVSEAEHASSRFLANVSHELRTPLNSILGFSELLLEGVGSLEDEKQKRFIANVRRSAQHLLSLINDVVDMSKIESGRMELHVDRVAIEPLVGSTVEMVSGFAAPRRISVISEIERELPMIFADAVKVRQIVYNLLSNAVRFSIAGGVVNLAVRLVSLDRSPLGADAIEIRVADQGSGIPKDALKAILAAERHTAIYSNLGLGPGLGLAIVRRFAEMHGGRLAAESRPGEGSSFRVWLPLDAREFDTDKISMTV
ncbi:MAG: HAMP domain-containing histidine kinase [Thermoanaerobaculia bacterium]|nr:HAMP domain-containing histidine kinase [Thermoanaerobaculia bacterium]